MTKGKENGVGLQTEYFIIFLLLVLQLSQNASKSWRLQENPVPSIAEHRAGMSWGGFLSACGAVTALGSCVTWAGHKEPLCCSGQHRGAAGTNLPSCLLGLFSPTEIKFCSISQPGAGHELLCHCPVTRGFSELPKQGKGVPGEFKRDLEP